MTLWLVHGLHSDGLNVQRLDVQESEGPISAYASGFVDEREMPDQMDPAEAAHRRFIAKMFRTLPVTARSC